MSAKGRKQQPQNDEEFHPTPEWSVDTIITSDLLKLPGGTWIEPCAGGGNIIKAVNRLRDDINWIIVELQERFHDQLAMLARPGRDRLLPLGDFVHREWPDATADVLIMNPPFSLTMQFIEAAFRRAQHVLCLQRKGFFGTQSRAPWLREYCPDDFTLWKRASFRSDKQTDSTEYSWYYWPPDPFGRVGREHRRRRIGRIAMLDEPKYQHELVGVATEAAGKVVPPALAPSTLGEAAG